MGLIILAVSTHVYTKHRIRFFYCRQDNLGIIETDLYATLARRGLERVRPGEGKLGMGGRDT